MPHTEGAAAAVIIALLIKTEVKAALITVVTFPYKNSAINSRAVGLAIGFLIFFCWLRAGSAAETLPEGPGKVALDKMCARCHGLDVVTTMPRTGAEWQAVVDNMVQRGATGSTDEIHRVVEYLTKNFGRQPVGGQSATVPRTSRVMPPLKTFPQRRNDPETMDWSAFGRDQGARRYSPLTQINTENVSKLVKTWTYDTGEKGKPFEVTPILINGILYVMTPSQHVVALQPESGHELWNYDAHVNRGAVGRGVSYWPGAQAFGARIVFGTGDGQLIALDAASGRPILEFGDSGKVNLRPPMLDRFPKAP